MNMDDIKPGGGVEAVPQPPEHLCYVRCNFCATVLAVVIPWKRLLDTVTVKCGHCSNLSFLTTRPPPPPPPSPPVLLPRPDHQFTLQSFNFMEKLEGGCCSEQNKEHSSSSTVSNEPVSPKQTFVVKPPEKKHRLPSAYNRFMKEEIQRIKAANPEIPHREAFSSAAKNWARYIPSAASENIKP